MKNMTRIHFLIFLCFVFLHHSTVARAEHDTDQKASDFFTTNAEIATPTGEFFSMPGNSGDVFYPPGARLKVQVTGSIAGQNRNALIKGEYFGRINQIAFFQTLEGLTLAYYPQGKVLCCFAEDRVPVLRATGNISSDELLNAWASNQLILIRANIGDLAEKARSGNKDAIEALAYIPHPNAKQELLKLKSLPSIADLAQKALSVQNAISSKASACLDSLDIMALKNDMLSAAKTGDLKKIQSLLKAKHELLKIKDDQGLTPLYFAVQESHTDTVDALLNEGAEVNLKYNKGITLLHVAVQKGNIEIAKLLLAKGAEVNAKDKYDWTPLYDAAVKGNKGMVELLLSRQADASICNNDKATPLHAAYNKEVAELLLTKGVAIDATDNEGAQPLHCAAAEGKKDVVELLVAKGAAIDAKAKKGGTPLHSAAYYGHRDVVEFLLAHGAEINAKNNYAHTPLDLAVGKNQKEVIDLLKKKGAK